MDGKDLEILQLLEENGRIPLGELAASLGLSEGEAGERIRALEAARIIRKVTAVIDWEKAGASRVSAIIDLKIAPERDFGYDKIAERIARFRQVDSLYLVSGVYDLQLLVTGKDMNEVSRFVSEQIAPMDHIREAATHIIMKIYKENGNQFFEKEGGERLPLSF
ncbi:MAG TPA: Lrp/AsnC family transcriptional regulator [Methanomicrobiales archaeon]|nr:Lrp/AsnC family transcriptional regulator [Methanomicrobiales archaeon]HVP24780.1 Lrp/AsnC family transcriptional regulator [Methanomicrobiales archaeon]